MANFTYSDFRKALKESGMEAGFSLADLRLAENFPDAGMDLLYAKKQWQSAPTAPEREAAHTRAEQIRAAYGNYSGGEDGSDFIAGPLSPLSLGTDLPEYQSAYADRLNGAADRQVNYEGYTPPASVPVYQNTRADEIARALSDVTGRGDFSYDPDNSPLNSAIKKQYMRMVDRAAEGTLASAAAKNGGRVSSYAVTAAAEAANRAAAEYGDRQMDIAKLSAQIYDANYEAALSRLKAVQGVEQSEYDRYLDELDRYNTDRKQGLSEWKENYDRLAGETETLADLEKLSRAAYENDRDAVLSQEKLRYQALTDHLARQDQAEENAWDRALSAAKYGDLSGLARLGVDTTRYKEDEAYQKAVDMAQIAAKYGDYSGLASLGIDTSALKKKEAAEKKSRELEEKIQLAGLAAKYGDYSVLADLGIDTTRYQQDQDYQNAVEKALLQAEYGDYSGLEGLGIRPYR